MTNIDMNKVQRINFTLNPKNSFDLEVLVAIEKLKNEGYNVSARIKKLLINDANCIVTTNAVAPATVHTSVPSTVSATNDADEDDFNNDIDIDGIEIDMDDIMNQA